MFDTLKGSFYANPMRDNSDVEEHLKQKYPSYCRHVLCATAPEQLHFHELLAPPLCRSLERLPLTAVLFTLTLPCVGLEHPVPGL